MDERRVSGGRPGNSRQHRRFRKGQIHQGLAEIKLGGGFKAEVPMPQINLVRVHGENLRFAEVALDLNGQQGFLNFPAKAFVGVRNSMRLSCWVRVLAPCALRHSSTSLTAARTMSQNVHSPVTFKVPVLDGNHRIPQRPEESGCR